MKIFIRIVIVLGIVAALAIVYSITMQTVAPESSIIASERNRMMATFDKTRAARDPAYAVEFEDKAAFLEYRMAIALMKEDDPDRAVPVLQNLIKQEEASGSKGTRRSRSLEKEAGYYEALAQAYDMKHDAAAVQKAADTKTSLMAKAEEARRKERLEEGKWIGRSGD